MEVIFQLNFLLFENSIQNSCKQCQEALDTEYRHLSSVRMMPVPLGCNEKIEVMMDVDQGWAFSFLFSVSGINK